MYSDEYSSSKLLVSGSPKCSSKRTMVVVDDLLLSILDSIVETDRESVMSNLLQLIKYVKRERTNVGMSCGRLILMCLTAWNTSTSCSTFNISIT